MTEDEKDKIVQELDDGIAAGNYHQIEKAVDGFIDSICGEPTNSHLESPLTKFEVGDGKWRCCNHIRKSEYCPECGSRRPETTWSSRIDDIIQTWEQDKYVCEKTAQTLRDKMTRTETALERIASARTWRELMSIVDENRIDHWRLTDQKKLEDAKQVIEDQAKSNYSQNDGRRMAMLRKANRLGYWIKTVKELLVIINAHSPK